MKKLLLVTLLLSALAGHAQNKKALDEKYGFRDMKFESDLSTYTDLVQAPSANPASPIQYYTRSSDDLKVGAATLSKILYQFYAGKFVGVALFTQGASSSTALQDALRAQYGYGSPALRVTYESRWNGSKVEMYYDYSPRLDEAIVRMYSKSMHEAVEKAGKQAAKAAKSDL